MFRLARRLPMMLSEEDKNVSETTRNSSGDMFAGCSLAGGNSLDLGIEDLGRTARVDMFEGGDEAPQYSASPKRGWTNRKLMERPLGLPAGRSAVRSEANICFIIDH